MEVNSVSSGNSNLFSILGQKMSGEVEFNQKVAKMNLELQMEAEKMAMATKALVDFYA